MTVAPLCLSLLARVELASMKSSTAKVEILVFFWATQITPVTNIIRQKRHLKQRFGLTAAIEK